MNVAALSNQERLTIVFDRAAGKLGGEVGRQLKAMGTPGAIATMVGVLVLWAGSHFFGIGEIADIVLLIVGYIALGGVAVEAAHHLFDFGNLSLNARQEAELNAAAEHLVKAITLIGIQAVLALLLKKKPGDTFKSSYSPPGRPNRFPASYAAARAGQPRAARSGGLFYKPTLTFTRNRPIGTGATTGRGDIIIGRAAYGLTAAERAEQIRLTLFHERIHQLLAPKLNVLRELRTYTQMSAYRRSYVLRYIEEALAETYAQLRVHGLSREYLLKGLTFPVNNHYAITITALRGEAAGVLLGPVTVGGMIHNVYYGATNRAHH